MDIEITLVSGKVRFVMNDQTTTTGYKEISKKQDNILDVCLAKSDDHVMISFIGGSHMNLTMSATPRDGQLIVSTVATVAPSDNADLYTKLEALL